MVQDLENEIWVSIKGYEGIYEISNYCRVKSLSRYISFKGNKKRLSTEKIRNTYLTHMGYTSIELSKDGFNKKHTIHRLMAINFLGEHPTKLFVNHKNGIKTDNSIENLEWVTIQENVQHSFDVLGRKQPTRPKGINNHFYGKGHLKKTCKKVKCDTLGVLFPSIRSASRELGVGMTALISVLEGRATHIDGLTFKYL